MRVLICAGRYYADDRRCRQVLDAFQRLHETRVVIHGGSQFLG
ncbi:SLOG family protein, partial [Pseudomonas sp. SIMBA_077]